LLYFNQSIYIHSHIETPHGVRRLNGGGVWQFRPETMQLEVFLRGFVNPWGHHFDRWGQSFVTDGAYGEGINYGLPGAYYVTAQGASRFLAGLNPGSPKHCGLEVLSGRHLPPEWRGNLLTNDFRGHRVCRFVLSEDGAGYASQEKAELIKTNHPAFRPIDIKMGPDGAIYIADWYNPIIQHGEVDFRDPRRDQTRGRIWRVTAKGRPLVPRPHLSDASTEALLEALKAPEDWTRQHAKRVLKERGNKVLPALAGWVRKLDSADAEYEHHLLEALWTYQALDVVEPRLLSTLLHAQEPRARAAATRVLSHWQTRLTNARELLTERVADEHPRVRLEAVRAFGQMADLHAIELAMRAVDRPVDKYVDYALWLTARELEPHWLPALRKGQLDFGGNVGHLLFALQAVGSSAAVQPLVELIQSGKVAKEREEGVLAALAALGGPKELSLVLDRALGKGDAATPSSRLLEALEQAARQRGVRPEGNLGRVGQLLDSENEGNRAAGARLAGLWRVEALRPRLLEYAQMAATSEPLRQAAIEGLALLGGPASRTAIEKLTTPDHPLSVRRQAVIALASLDLDTAARAAVEMLASGPEGSDPSAVYAAFVGRKNGDAALARALAGRRLPADVAKLGVRAVRGTGRDAPPLVDALTKAGALTSGLRALAPKEMQEMVAEVAQRGDPARGERIFRRKDQACLKCHAIAGAGGLVGPDLVSIGASAPVDYLIESILLPNKVIKENYHSLVVATKDGKVYTGIKVRETNAELILRDAEDREIAVPLKAIEEKTNGGSLMPEGLADSLTRAELVDMVRFLVELGKVGPYSVSKARLVRRWQALEPTGAAYTLLSRTRIASVAGTDPALTWGPAYSTVAGVLPPDELPTFTFREAFGNGSKQACFVRCQLDASTAGKVKLRLNSVAGLTLWLDGTPVEFKEETVLDLASGMHTLTFAIDRGQRREGLRCELDDVNGSGARVQIVGGK
jgi:putative heme-binding domain-containing protein